MGELFDRYFDPAWRTNADDKAIWADIDKIPDAELWRTHERRRERLVTATRERLQRALVSRGAPSMELTAAEEVLDPQALTIGFARRFATYKRATLIFQDKERLYRLLHNPERPVQLIFAGKAHPHDIPGKDLIREIANTARMPEFRNRIVFLENYDMAIARLLVQGVDVWLNNPRRPEEASGTSGMKVIYNGGLNMSTLDGWWAEAYDPSVGWEIGNGEEYPQEKYELQNKIEANAIYTLLESVIVPLYYERARDGLPREWIGKVKNSVRKLAPFFNTNRMVMEYTEKYYMPAYQRFERLTSPDFKRGVEFAKWRQRVDQIWNQIRVARVDTSGNALMIGTEQEVHAWVELGGLTPVDVRVQIYYGTLTTHGDIEHGETVEMESVGHKNGVHEFAGKIAYKTTGQHGLSIRVLPHHDDLPTPFQRGLIRWA
jgi:starch phosphorylase